MKRKEILLTTIEDKQPSYLLKKNHQYLDLASSFTSNQSLNSHKRSSSIPTCNL